MGRDRGNSNNRKGERMKEEIYKNMANALIDMLGDEEIMSNCCSAPFNPPGHPDNDICSSCGEHADTWDED